jgi:DNA-binding CsgD family transcriptional regulator
MTASERDLRALAGMVSDHRADLPAQGLPMSLLSDLASQIRCDAVLFEGLDSKRQGTWFAESFPADDGTPDDGLAQAHWQHYWDCRPCSHPDRTGDVRSVIKIADFYSAREWHSTGMYCDLYQPQGIEHELMLTLPAAPAPPRRTLGPGRTLRLFLFRGPGADFSEADRALLTLLRPHLHQAYLDAERRRHPVPELTARHWQLLDLLAAGHTNAQIARRLGLSEGTVRTHLENIYRRLQVSSRTAAVTRAFQDPAAPSAAPADRRLAAADGENCPRPWGLPEADLTGLTARMRRAPWELQTTWD